MRQLAFTSHDVARMVQVSPSTVLGWVDRGLLAAYRTPGGHRRIDGVALVRFLREHAMPIPKELAPITRVLIIDDELPFLSTAKRLLKRRAPHLELDTAAGAVEGLLKVGTFRPDAVLLDAYMPGIDGVEVCTRLKQSEDTRNITVIAVTGQPSPEIREQFTEAGAAECLVKPLDIDAIVALLGIEPARETQHG